MVKNEDDYKAWKVKWTGYPVCYDMHGYMFQNGICCVSNWRRLPPGWQCFAPPAGTSGGNAMGAPAQAVEKRTVCI